MTIHASNLTRLQAEAQSRALDASKRRLAKVLSPPVPGLQNRQPQLTRRWAKVSSIHATGTVDVLLDGKTVTGLSCLSSYSPVLNDPVILDMLGTDLVVMGTVGINPSRLTGTQGRYVGQTSGPPATGAPFQAGDFADDPTRGLFWTYTGSAWKMAGGFNWIGSGPGNATPILFESDFAYVSTDASGNFSLTFGTAFPNGLLGVVATIGSTGSGDLTVQCSDTNGRDRLHFTGRIIHTTTGAGLASSGAMAVNYMALGY